MPRKTAALALVALCGVSLPGADAVPHGRMRFPMDARAALMQTETSKLSALPKSYQTGEFPDSVKADIASGTCTQIEEAFKYAHTDDVTFNTVGSACLQGIAGYESFGEFESPHSSCGLEDATVEGKLTRCVYKEAGDFVREEYLLGPFESTGGNDWWDMDIVDLQLAVASNYTYIASWGVTMHDADTGEALSLPPLHTHHITLLDPTGRTKEGSGEPPSPNQPSWNFYGNGTRLPWIRDMVVNMLVNDVRLAGSPPLRWYANLTLTHIGPEVTGPEGTELKTLSLIKLDTAEKSTTRFLNFEVPSKSDSFFITTGTWPASGEVYADPVYADPGYADPVIFSHLHSHMGLFSESFLFAGTPAQLGLEDPTFGSTTGCDPVPMNRTVFKSSQEMITRLAAQCPSCFSFSFSRNNPDATTKLLCHPRPNLADVDGVWYDRASDIDCYANRFRIAKGQPWTVLAFFDGGKPTMPPYKAESFITPGYSSVHHIWYLRYVDDESPKIHELHQPLQLAKGYKYNETACVGAPTWVTFTFPTSTTRMIRS